MVPVGSRGCKALKEVGKTRNACLLQVEEMTSPFLAGRGGEAGP